MQDIKSCLYQIGIIPVVVIEDADTAVDLAKALMNAGLPCAEVTFRTSAAEESIKRIKKSFPEIILGAGTILSIDQAEIALAAGAEFIVTPGFDAEIVDYCIKRDVLIFPGCVTPSEIIQAYKRGIDVVKFFPAGTYGGLSAIKALAAPFTTMKFIPTGGVNSENLAEYIDCNAVFACGGTWMVKNNLINNHKYDEIKILAKEAVEIVSKCRRLSDGY